MRAEPALRAAPEIVCQPQSRHRRNGRHGDADDCSDAWEAQAAETDPLRRRCQERVVELASAVREAGCVPPGRPVAQIELELLEAQADLHGVDGHARLDPEPCGDGKALCARTCREDSLARQRLTRLVAAAEPDESPRRPFRDPEASSLLAGEHSDCQVGIRSHERSQVAVEIGVAEKQRSPLELALRERERLALSPARQADHPRPRGFGPRRGCVGGAVVGYDHGRVRKRLAQARDRVADSLLLVARGHEDREPLRHRSGRGNSGGRTPSEAVSSVP
jgi:hypothetical protein